VVAICGYTSNAEIGGALAFSGKITPVIDAIAAPSTRLMAVNLR